MEGNLSWAGQSGSLLEFSADPRPVCGVGWQEARQEGALQSDSAEQLSLELAWGLRAFLSGGVRQGEALPHREEAAGVPGCVKPPPWRDHAGAEVWHVARTQERSGEPPEPALSGVQTLFADRLRVMVGRP